jgi:hypothetical protein
MGLSVIDVHVLVGDRPALPSGVLARMVDTALRISDRR